MRAIPSWLMACFVAVAAAGLLEVALSVEMPSQPASLRAIGGVTGKVIFMQSRGVGLKAVQEQGVVRATFRGDVVETVDLGPGNGYSFHLWPGTYSLRAEEELQARRRSLCTEPFRIKAGQTQRQILYCKLPPEHASKAAPGRTSSD